MARARTRPFTAALGAGLLLALQEPAMAAADGKAYGLWMGLPFAGLLLSIAIMPLAAPHLWHHHYGKIAIGWMVAALAILTAIDGVSITSFAFFHTMVEEYVPFILLVGALFVIAGGILIKGNLHGNPATNTVILLIGTLLASIIGTTGASMVLIRPLIRANDERRHNVHVVVFFIFLVSNIGGSLTPLGDPPLFLGFLQGVSFFWTTIHIAPETAFASVILLALFYAIDRYHYAQDAHFRSLADPTPDDTRVGIAGWINVLLIFGVVGLVLLSGIWKPGIEVSILGVHIGLQDLTRDAGLVVLALVSLALTPKGLRADNGFSFEPIKEVAKLFIGIFVTMIPVIAMLKAGREGAMAGLVDMATNPGGSPNNVVYFWLTGILSSFLDNAPTYLVFFNLAGGDAQQLMGPMATTLAAISAGAVFMGANSYIGNAPNFMVKAIAEDRGVKMPSFFGYLGWSGAILVPLFALMTPIFFL